MNPDKTSFVQIIEKNEAELLESWLKEQLTATTRRKDLIKDAELREQSRQFLYEFSKAVRLTGAHDDVRRPE